MRACRGVHHPLAKIAHSESRPRWHTERRQAKVNVRPRSSGNNTNVTDKSCCDAHTRTATGDGEHHKQKRETLWMKRECAAVVVSLCLLSVCWFLFISLAHALFQFGSIDTGSHHVTIFSWQRSVDFAPPLHGHRDARQLAREAGSVVARSATNCAAPGAVDHLS